MPHVVVQCPGRKVPLRAVNEYAHIYIIYIREVPPVGGPRKPPKEFQIPDPKTLEERQQVAQDFATELKASIPVLLDTVGDQVGKPMPPGRTGTMSSTRRARWS